MHANIIGGILIPDQLFQITGKFSVIQAFAGTGIGLGQGCHNNGGLKGDIWWESNIKHLFPVGEVNGTLGVYRPGGSALNSTQVGSFRAAQYIAANYTDEPMKSSDFVKAVEKTVSTFMGTEKGNILAKAQDSVTFLCNEFHGNEKAMGHLKTVLANQVMEDVKGEIGSSDNRTIKSTEEAKLDAIEIKAKEEGISFSKALKANWKE